MGGYWVGFFGVPACQPPVMGRSTRVGTGPAEREGGHMTDEQPHANAKGPAPIVRPVNYQARRQELESKVSDLSSSLNEFQEAPVEIRQEVAAALRPIVAWYEELT